MQIDISTAEHEQLAAYAAAAGFDDVSLFVRHHLLGLMSGPAPEAVEKLDLSITVGEIHQGEREIAAGRFRDAAEAFIEFGKQRGYKTPE